MKLKYSYIFLIGLIFLSSFSILQETEIPSNIKLITKATKFKAGDDITLKFATSNSSKPFLYCTNSYSTMLIKPNLENNILHYKFPKNLCKKRGIIHWKLNKTILMGKLNVVPLQEVATMETYIGPPSIEAGRKDYSMHIIIPTDSLDNPLAEKTLVTTKFQFLNQQKKEAIYIKNLIAYKNLYSPLKDGRMLISSECLDENSKEYTVIVYPANPTNFKISAKRHHSYADGNQITNFSTSAVKDEYNNIVSDGTFVNFFIRNKKGNILKTSGTTIKGIATAKMIHPDYETTWKVKAYVEGMAESNTISVNYKQVIEDFKVDFSNDNRLITVGPLQSFMQQMVPDGLVVSLFVYKNDVLINSEIKTSYNGFVNFNLNTAAYKKDTYTLKIVSAGLKKEFKKRTLW